MIYETDTDLTYIWGGSAWQQVSGGTAVGNSGLVFVKSQTIGTTVSSVTVTDAFSATYDNYRILVNTTGSVAQNIQCRLDGSSTAYAQVVMYMDLGSNTVVGFQQSNGGEFRFVGGGGGTAGNSSLAAFDLMNPFTAAFTRMPSGPYFEANSLGISNAEHRVATSYTGFVILPNSGTFTGGTITVYGYRKA
jgi:hypothetical protein